MTKEKLIKKYPRLYHMAESGTWDSIQTHGLLSTGALLKLFEVSGKRRNALLTQRRADSEILVHPKLGRATIRDNKVLQDHLLEKCLQDGLSPTDWYALLNARVFFWPTEKRLHGLLMARPYRNKAHCVLEVDTAELIKRYEKKIALSPINSGSTIFNPAERGLGTFKRIDDYDLSNIAEVAVDDGIPDVRDLVITAKEMLGAVDRKAESKKVRTLHVLFSR